MASLATLRRPDGLLRLERDHDRILAVPGSGDPKLDSAFDALQAVDPAGDLTGLRCVWTATTPEAWVWGMPRVPPPPSIPSAPHARVDVRPFLGRWELVMRVLGRSDDEPGARAVLIRRLSPRLREASARFAGCDAGSMLELDRALGRLPELPRYFLYCGEPDARALLPWLHGCQALHTEHRAQLLRLLMLRRPAADDQLAASLIRASALARAGQRDTFHRMLDAMEAGADSAWAAGVLEREHERELK